MTACVMAKRPCKAPWVGARDAGSRWMPLLDSLNRYQGPLLNGHQYRNSSRNKESFMPRPDQVKDTPSASPGTVYLVGAGPGDPGLITVKGLEKIRTADVIVYDYLAGSQLL